MSDLSFDLCVYIGGASLGASMIMAFYIVMFAIFGCWGPIG